MSNSIDKGAKSLNVPPLRFPEFSGEWDRCLLSKYLYENKSRNKDGRFTKTDVLSVSGEEGIVNQIELLGRSFAGKSVLDYHIVKTGNIVYTKSPLKEYPHGIIKENRGKDGIVSTLYAVYHVNNNAIGRFIEAYFSLPLRINRYFKPIVRIGAKHDMKIGNSEVLDNSVIFPQLEEQQKIVDFFSLIDKRIETQKKIIEELKKLKSAISKLVFSPNLLLESYIAISNIGILKNGYAFQSNTYNNTIGKYRIVTIGNVTGERYINSGEYNCVVSKPCDMQVHQELKENDILISLTGNVGRVSLCKAGNYLLNQRVGLLELKTNINREFIFQALSCQKFEHSMMACAQGAAQMNIGKNDIENYQIPYSSNPSIISLIARILKSYDQSIDIESGKLKLYIQQKTHLLSQMFI